MTCGEGGILLTNNESFANNARRFSSLGYAAVSSKKSKISKEDIQSPDYDRHISLGFNYRLSEVNSAVALGQLERLEILVNQRIKVAKLFLNAVSDYSFIRPQHVPENYVNSYWTLGLVLESNNGDNDWKDFKNLFTKRGGDSYYAAWKLSYQEPLFKKVGKQNKLIWQDYNTNLCPNAEYLQPRLIQMKTNYWDISEAEIQAEILNKSLKEFSG